MSFALRLAPPKAISLLEQNIKHNAGAVIIALNTSLQIRIAISRVLATSMKFVEETDSTER